MDRVLGLNYYMNVKLYSLSEELPRATLKGLKTDLCS